MSPWGGPHRYVGALLVPATMLLLCTPALASHVRPKSASPVAVSLVPAFGQCTAPNRTHGPPLSFPSCNPPGQVSTFLTIGTPDANGAAAKSTGIVRLKVNQGSPGPPHDTTIVLNVDIADVRCTATAQPCGPANAQGGADYTGEFEVRVTLRITDTFNSMAGGGGTEHATMTDHTLRLSTMFFPCAATSDTSVGSTCSFASDLSNWGASGVTPEGQRTIWEMGPVQVFDGGPDGVASTNDNTLFATQGIFIP